METKSQKILLILMIVVILGVGAVMFYKNKKKSPAPAAETPQTVIQKIDQNIIPPGLPQDLPIEKDKYALDNAVANYGGGAEIQNVRTYYSAKTVEENFKIFSEYFKSHNWQTSVAPAQKNLRSIYAINRDKTKGITVNISKNSLTGDVTVSIVSVPLRK